LIVLDTSVVLAFMNRRDADHGVVRDWMERTDDALSTTPLIVAELDHLVLASGGASAASALRDDLVRGAYQVEWWSSALPDTIAAARRYESMELGLADASLIALAAHLGTTKIATLDERHFRTVRPLTGKVGAFTLLPKDSG
jgi:uncharacterized protein